MKSLRENLFKRTTRSSLPTTPIVYPHGTAVKTERGYFLIRSGKRYHLPTDRIVLSWSFPRIVETSEAAVAAYKVVAKLGFRDGSLIHNISDGRIYLVSNNERRTIKSPDALTRIGASRSQPTLVSEYEAQLQRLGEDLT